MENDPRYLKGIELFNAHDFFEAHEVWEELWHEVQGDAKDFIQGLIQAATALHHFQNNNLKGARILYDSFRELLSRDPHQYLRIDKSKLLGDMEACFGGLIAYSPESLPGRYSPEKDRFPVQLETSKIPYLKLIDA